MRISDVYSAKGLKFKLNLHDRSAAFRADVLVEIEPGHDEHEFLIRPFGEGSAACSSLVFCRTDRRTATYIRELVDAENSDALRCLFEIEGVNNGSLEIQAYTFRSVTKYQTPIFIEVPDGLLERVSPEILYSQYIWDQLGEPALFCLNYKNSRMRRGDVRFLSGKRCLEAESIGGRIVADRESYLRDRHDLPIDVFVAPEIRFVPASDVLPGNSELAEDIGRISDAATYFDRWEAYNELSKRLLEQENAEFGELPYSSYNPKVDLVGTTYEFIVDEELDGSFKGKELAAGERTAETDDTGGSKWRRQIPVGTITKISGKKITTYIQATEGLELLPEAGSLFLYTAGDKFIMARRDAAKERMLKNQSPIPSIVALIEMGAAEYLLPQKWGYDEPVTNTLRRNLKEASTLNEQQKEAIRIAINSPDIALIQGPPGTGKTTVIKAICERFREIYEAREQERKKIDPDHVLRSPKILITSFQNDAVDNAISAPLPGDIPAYRKTAKRVRTSTMDQYQTALDAWFLGVHTSINERIETQAAAEFVEHRQRLKDEYLSYKNAGEPIELAANLIKRYLSYTHIQYPQELVDIAQAVISTGRQDGTEDVIPDPIVAYIQAQRTDLVAFSDDGRVNARRLLYYLRIRDDIDESMKAAIEAVCRADFTETEFSDYVAAVSRLRKQYCKAETGVDVKDKRVVNECLLAMAECFNKQYMKTLSDLDSQKSLILSEFLLRLEQEYENIVKKYAMTTAATCQVSLDLRDEVQKTYDLVVVDEAARANPLDLFIPMSMGKKIVLVGDHKQLPHMLEPGVLKNIKSDPKFKDIPEIEKSLFERLFDMFSKEPNAKAVSLTEQYRMHPDICDFVSEEFYDETLKTSEEVTAEKRSSPKMINNGKALTFVHVSITRGGETRGKSKSRQAEIDAICQDVKEILKVDREATIGIITFYAAQAAKLKDNLVLTDDELSRVQVGTVDAFQGKQYDYVLLSCVRSNRPRNAGEIPEVGFLKKPNRLCVAFSRARKQLIAYGDADTLQQIPAFKKLHGVCTREEVGCYREY